MNAPNLPKVAVIAGVGPGIGASLARRFARENCKVALLARSGEYLDSLAAELNKRHPNIALAIACDLTDQEQITAAFSQIREKLGPVDLLVNNASGGGGPRGAKFLDLKDETFEQAWRVGVYAGMLCSREAARDMLAAKDGPSGNIFFTGATSSVRGSSVAFSSAKFATRGLAQALARELWPQGIHVAHFIIDGVIGDGPEIVNGVDAHGEPLMHPDSIAETYWQTARQERSSWSLEIDLRPHREKFYE